MTPPPTSKQEESMAVTPRSPSKSNTRRERKPTPKTISPLPPGNATDSPKLIQVLGRRIRFTAKELALVRLCVQNSHRYTKPVGEFWKFIRSEFENRVGKSIADPLGKMNKMVKDREKIIAQQKDETGTVQQDTNFTQAIDEWRMVLERHREQEKVRRKAQEEKKADEVFATLQEVNLMKTLKEKRPLPSDLLIDELSTYEEDGDDMEETITSRSTSCSKSKGKERLRKRQRFSEAAATTSELASAIRGFGENLSAGIIAMSEAISNQRETKKQMLPEPWNTRFMTLEADSQEMKAMVGQMLAMMKQMVPPQLLQ